ncbi:MULTISPECIES: alpha/beta hydrolase [Dickeya]|uniref:alpha/beta hydrolase n=1 Tax=Dickeya TaxID=204037 RepID=UPI001AEC7A95|nr:MULTISPECIES: alpha/beta hydrolase [Dickeya]MBP2837626.1 alpha/beta hydrolase [Dickeya parazeae]UCZ75538.1 alpha/beta hydrolase [Dickeya zeae]
MMLDELKNFVLLHSYVLNVGAETRAILPDIHHLGDDAPHSWSQMFYYQAQQHEKQGEWLKACSLYNLARFPYPETPLQHECNQHCQRLFHQQYIESGAVTRVSLSQGRQVCYVRKKNTNNVIIINGGIISLKEQWVNLVGLFERFDVTVVLTEMPGVGENQLPYNEQSFRMYSDVLDYLAQDRADIRCHIFGLSFSGFIAYKNSLTDNRIVGITMAGTPLDSLYHDREVYRRLPYVTRLVIGHNVGKTHPELDDDDKIFQYLDSTFVMHPGDINHGVRLYYVQSLRDEVIPNMEADTIRRLSNRTHILSLDDVHGSPSYGKTVRVYLLWSLLNSLNLSQLLSGVARLGFSVLRRLKR